MLKPKLITAVITIIYTIAFIISCDDPKAPAAIKKDTSKSNGGVFKGKIDPNGSLKVGTIEFSDLEDFKVGFIADLLQPQNTHFANATINVTGANKGTDLLKGGFAYLLPSGAGNIHESLIKSDGTFSFNVGEADTSSPTYSLITFIKINLDITYSETLKEKGCMVLYSKKDGVIPDPAIDLVVSQFESKMELTHCLHVDRGQVLAQVVGSSDLAKSFDTSLETSKDILSKEYASYDERYYTQKAAGDLITSAMADFNNNANKNFAGANHTHSEYVELSTYEQAIALKAGTDHTHNGVILQLATTETSLVMGTLESSLTLEKGYIKQPGLVIAAEGCATSDEVTLDNADLSEVQVGDIFYDDTGKGFTILTVDDDNDVLTFSGSCTTDTDSETTSSIYNLGTLQTVGKLGVGLEPTSSLEMVKMGTNDLLKVSSSKNNHGDMLIIKNEGKVGINNMDPSYQLDVDGDVRATNFIGNGSNLTGLGETGGVVNPGSTTIGADSGDSNASAIIAFQMGGSNAMVVDNQGQVGIGVDDAAAPLQIDGGDDPSKILLTNTASGATGGDGLLISSNDTTAVINQQEAAGTLNLAIGGTNVITVKGTEVGIGTTTPSKTLDVEATGTGDTEVAHFTTPGITGDGTVSAIIVGKLAANENAAVFGYRFDTLSGDEGAYMTVYGDEAGTGIFVKNGGNVGIGTIEPEDTLHVNGTFRLEGSATSINNHSTFVNTDTHLKFFPSSNSSVEKNINFYYGNQEAELAMAIENTGYVGIGTDDPGYKVDIEVNDATYSSHIAGFDSNSDTRSSVLINNSGAGDAAANFRLFGATEWAIGADDSDADKFKIASSGVLGTLDRLSINTTGEVGIGASGTTYQFQVEGSKSNYVASFFNDGNDAANKGIRIQAGQDASPNANVYLEAFDGDGTGVGALMTTASGNFKVAAEDGLSLAGATASDHMFIKSDGTVGIGTTNPEHALHVFGTNTADLAFPLKISHGTANNASSAVGVLFSTVANATDTYRGKGALVYQSDGTTFDRGDFYFLQDNAADTNNPQMTDAVMAIKNSGNVGIGTTNPSSQLHLQGNLTTALTGTVSVGTDTAVTGSGTAFTTELLTGSAIKIADEIFTVSAIASDTALTLDSAHTAGASDVTAYTDSDLFTIDTGDAQNLITASANGPALEITHATPTIRINNTTSNSQSNLNFWGSDGSIGITADSNNQAAGTEIRFKVDGNEYVRIEEGGNVGIGTTNPSSQLHLQGNLTTALTGTVSVGTDTAVTGSGTSFSTELLVGSAIKIADEIFTVSAIISDASLTLDSAHTAGASDVTAYKDSGLFALDTGDAQNVLSVATNGNIGIGTTDPNTILDIRGGQLGISDASVGNVPLAQFQGQADSNSGNNSGSLYIKTRNGANDTIGTRMTIKYTGNVGIGTTDPQAKLEIVGGAAYFDSTGTTNKETIVVTWHAKADYDTLGICDTICANSDGTFANSNSGTCIQAWARDGTPATCDNNALGSSCLCAGWKVKD